MLRTPTNNRQTSSPNSPMVPRRGSAAVSVKSQNNTRLITPGQTSTAANDSHEDIQSLKNKIVMLEKDLERRQESYITRERAFKTRIEELDEELNNQRAKKTGDFIFT